MIKQVISINEVIEFLNELIEIDPVAIHGLIEHREVCNEKMADHPTVQVTCYNGPSRVGLLGILNGMFGKDNDGWGPLVAVFGENGKLSKFEKVSVVNNGS